MTEARRLADSFVHLGRGGTAVAQPPFAGMAWYQAYETRHAADGREGRLVSCHDFAENWDSWEMHPSGAEVVICTGGSIMLTQEFPDGRIDTVALQTGDYAINPPSVWHTADVERQASAVFITAGEGTQHRPR